MCHQWRIQKFWKGFYNGSRSKMQGSGAIVTNKHPETCNTVSLSIVSNFSSLTSDIFLICLSLQNLSTDCKLNPFSSRKDTCNSLLSCLCVYFPLSLGQSLLIHPMLTFQCSQQLAICVPSTCT